MGRGGCAGCGLDDVLDWLEFLVGILVHGWWYLAGTMILCFSVT